MYEKFCDEFMGHKNYVNRYDKKFYLIYKLVESCESCSAIRTMSPLSASKRMILCVIKAFTDTGLSFDTTGANRGSLNYIIFPIHIRLALRLLVHILNNSNN
ncbi:unnamed protein product [Medioppia subpectinata]|uniref:Uncharacterized protein n=1 Tax=Medioppia subpectinata TaxID=1979941 RepID=A0A7R9PY79_9ACAR|nr:unnamed protein product [Medioppia subpectinata]CAG2105603.1 unnamed protein product [Medioppia subpectinata]